VSQNSGEHRKEEESGAYKWFALIAIVLGAFVAVLNNSLINVALPKLMAVFGSSTEDIQWVLTGYMLASAVVIPMSGFAGDKFGYKKIFLLSLSGFTISSFLCGLAWSDTSLIVFRIIQGLTGGFIMPLSMAIIYSIMPRHQIGMALGLWGIAAMVAPAVGPTLSGYLIEVASWRWLFFLSLPIGVFAIAMGSILLRETPKKEEITFDLPGAVLSIVFFGTLLLALSKGQSEGWTSLYIVSLFFVAFFSMLLLVWVETGKEYPILDLRFFKNPTFTLSTLCSGFVMVGLFGGVFLTPLYLQNIQGLSAIDTGLVLMPQSIAMALMMPISGKLFDRFGVVPLGLIGLTVLGITTYDLHRLTMDTPNEWLDMVLTIRGIGIGLCMMPLTTVGMNAVERSEVGRASSVSNVFRQVMGSLSIAVLTSIMSARQTFHAANISEHVQVDSDAATQAIKMLGSAFAQGGVDAGTAQGGAVALIAGMVQKEALVRSIADTFLLSSIPVFICIPFIFFFIKRKKAAAPDASAKMTAKNQPSATA